MKKEILRYLLENKYNSNVNLTDFLREKFPDISRRDAKDAIIEMLNAKTIVGADATTITEIFKPRQELHFPLSTFTGSIVNLRISNIGEKELEDHGVRQHEMTVGDAVVRVSESTIVTNNSLRATNDSIIALNTKTETYYNQLKWATWAIAAATAVSMFVATFAFLQTCGKPQLYNIQPSQNLQQLLDSSLKLQKGIESSLQKAVKDSFYQKRQR